MFVGRRGVEPRSSDFQSAALTTFAIIPLEDTCNALPFELQSASRHGQIRTDNLYMFLVGPVGIEPTKFPSCKDGGLNLLAYGPVSITI